MSAHEGIKKWHEYFAEHKIEQLDALLADDVVFLSPVVHTPQEGKPITMKYLSAAASVLGNGSFKYVREVVDGDTAVLEFTNEIDGIAINGIDMIRFNDAGQITEFKVMVRPLKAIQKIHQQMGEMLAALAK
jgi:ketosteroid isomerase-like protein